MVEIVLPKNTASDGLHVTIGDRDVTGEFALRADGRILGVLHGLAEGSSKLSADLEGKHGASLMITNHKIGGPVFSGAQVKPFVCATPTATVGVDPTPSTNDSGLSTNAVDEQCNIATEVKLFYRTTATCNITVTPDPSGAPTPADSCFKPYNPAAAAPADLAMTTTDAGVTMPYIVRVERGTMNRGIYEFIVLFDPKADDPVTGWKPFARQRGWNGKVVYTFGPSSGQPRRQIRSEQHWNNEDQALKRGFLVALNSMTDSLYNSNRTLMTETVMMMKEKIIDSFGEITYMVGDGCSGGSINQLTAASIYPGLLDGIQPTCTYPDSETTAIEVADCALLVHAYNSAAWTALMATEVPDRDLVKINAKKAAINGHPDQTGCHAWVNLFSNLGRPGAYIPQVVLNNDTGETGPQPGVINPINNCQLPNSLVYSASNPDGVRCTGADHAVAIFGKVPETNRARTTNDNVGVQYGLKALLDDKITAEDFVTINEVIGGVDFDSNNVSKRSEGDKDAIATAYRAGIVSDGKHLARTAILDLRGFDDTNLPLGTPLRFGIHHIWRSFALRARLDDANGNHDNHVMWRFGTGLFAPPDVTLQAFLMMDKWLTAMKGDSEDAALEDKVVADKPEDAFDFCYMGTDFTTKQKDFKVCDTDSKLKPNASPRQVAGGPVAENVLKCALKPLDAADYNGKLSDAQINRLKEVFKDGVCDFSKPGIGQQDAESPLDFSAGPGGVPFPNPPSTKGP